MSRLQAILYYRYLGFSLKQIQTLLSATDQDLLPHLRQQLFELRREYKRLLVMRDTLTHHRSTRKEY